MRQIELIARVAWADYRVEWPVSLCSVLMLAAVLAPLLVLFGLKFGVVSTMTGRLIEDPRNREIVPIGSGRYDETWFDAMRARPDVAFVVPRTRSIAATIDLARAGERRGRIVGADVIPTAPSDPLLGKWARIPATSESVTISESVAAKLDVRAGDRIEGTVRRVWRQEPQSEMLTFRVLAVLPPAALQRDAVFVPLPVLVALEEYRNGRAVPAFGWPGDPVPAGMREFSSFRLYARSIHDVPRLRDLLRSQGLDVGTRAEEIETVETLDRNLSLLFRIVAGLGGAGFVLSLALNLLANVERKRRAISVLRLVGFAPFSVMLFPVFQAVGTAVLGVALAAAVYRMTQTIINVRFAPVMESGESVCLLLFGHFVAAGAITVAAAIMASLFGAFRARRIEPAEGLRDA